MSERVDGLAKLLIYLSEHLLRLKYFSDILRTSGWTLDVQLHVRDATLCIIRHLAPNLGECPDVFRLLQVKYFSDILQMSDSAQWPRHFCIIGQLMPNLAKQSDVFPFCYNSNISLIYCGRPVGLQMSESAQWPWCFCIIRQLTPNSAECSDVFPFITFHLSFFQIYFHCYLAYLISDIS